MPRARANGSWPPWSTAITPKPRNRCPGLVTHFESISRGFTNTHPTWFLHGHQEIRPQPQPALGAAPAVLDARRLGRENLEPGMAGERLLDMAFALVGDQRTGAEDQPPAGPQQPQGVVEHRLLQADELGDALAMPGVGQVRVAADGAGG